MIIFVKGSSQIKKNKLEAHTLNWSRDGSLGALLLAASEVGKGQKTDNKTLRRQMQEKPLQQRGLGDKQKERKEEKITWDWETEKFS